MLTPRVMLGLGPTLRHIFLAGERICDAPWSTLTDLGDRGGIPVDKMSKSCFATAYSVALLTQVANIGFDEQR